VNPASVANADRRAGEEGKSRLTSDSTTMSPEAGQRRGKGRLLPRLLQFVERWDIAWTIIAFNFAGFVVGTIFWYGGQLLEAADHWFLWLFIPDCPLFAGLFIVAFLGLRKGRDWRLFYTIAAFGLIKYGVWTVVFSLAYWLGGAPVGIMSLAMCLTHVGMILEGVYVAYRIMSPATEAGKEGGRDNTRHFPAPRSSVASRPGRRNAVWGFRRVDVLVAIGWFLLSDFVDYGLGHYPQFDPAMVSLPLIQWHTIAVTFSLAAIFLFLSRRPGAGAQIAL
jgi:uncharacterized membrane protein YpjA